MASLLEAVAEQDASDDELDDESGDEADVQLGFCEEPHHSDPLLFDDRDWHNWDGGIAGGAPQWLDARAPPGDATLRCEVCAAPMAFVLQVYAPREDEAFHRALYVFACRDARCGPKQTPTKRAFKAVRQQLARRNPLYAWEPDEPVDDAAAPDAPDAAARNAGAHGTEPGAIESVAFACPRYELVVEPEPCASASAPPRTHATDAEMLRRHRDVVDDGTVVAPADTTTQDVGVPLGADGGRIDDEQTRRFLVRVERAPSQVLRYERGGAPLWASAIGRCEDAAPEIPRCHCCGGPREFEFQVMPQLLHYLGVDRDEAGASDVPPLDWGVLAVFTCAQSCARDEAVGPVEEFVWYQPPLST